MKTLFKVLAGLGSLLVLILAGSLFYLDSIVQQAAVRVGSQVTGTAAELDSASVSLFSGELSLAGLRIGNPEGFSAPQVLFSLGSIELALDTSTLRQMTAHAAAHFPERAEELGRLGAELDVLCYAEVGDAAALAQRLQGLDLGRA